MKLYPNIIAGNHVQTEEVLDIVDPFTGQIIGTTCWVGKDEVAVAIDEGVRALKIVKNFSS